MAPLARHGDLLPLPVPLAEDCKLSGFGSRASSRRSHRRYRIHARVTETIEALICLAGYNTRILWPLQAPIADQSTALIRMWRLHTQRKMVSASLPEASLRRLLRHNAATQYAAVGSLPSYGEDIISLPTGSEQPCYLADILPDIWREVLESFEDAMLLLQAERDALADDADISQQFHFDPVLAEDAEAYARLLVRLHTARVIDFCGRGRVTIGLYFVPRKNGKLRFIADARRANALFRRPPRTVLGSMESWSRICFRVLPMVFFLGFPSCARGA